MRFGWAIKLDNPYRNLAGLMATATLAGLPLGVLTIQIFVVRRGQISATAHLGLAGGLAGVSLLGIGSIISPPLLMLFF